MVTKYRNLKFYGVVFPIDETVSLTAWLDGQLAFQGDVGSQFRFVDGPNIANRTDDLQLLFERIVGFHKMNFDLRIRVEGGALSFGKVTGNYIISYTDQRGDPKTTWADIAGGQEFKNNVRIFGRPVGDYNKEGTWFYHINNAVFECQISINPELSSIVPGARAYSRRLGTPDPFPMKF